MIGIQNKDVLPENRQTQTGRTLVQYLQEIRKGVCKQANEDILLTAGN